MLVIPETEAYEEKIVLDEIFISVTTSNRLIVILCSVQVTVNSRKVWAKII